MKDIVIAETGRLLLREFRAYDVEDLLALNSDENVLRYVLHPVKWTRADAEKFIENHLALYSSYGIGRWAVIEKTSNKLIGWCGLKYKAAFKHVDLGYRFLPAYWGKGFATEAAGAALHYGFSELGLERIVASYVEGNSASRHVLEKLGMKDCGSLEIDAKKHPLLERLNSENKNPVPAPHIATERLLLRKMHSADARVLFDLNKDPDVVMYTGDQAFNSFEEAKGFFSERINENSETGYGRWTVILKDTGEILGWCGLKFLKDEGVTDLGYRFFKRHWNKGYASEAAAATLKYGFANLGLERIVAKAMKLNKASLRVLEKCGMQFVADKEFALHEGLEYEMRSSQIAANE